MISCISKSWCSVKAFSETFAKQVAFGVHCRMICAMARGSFRGKGRRLVACSGGFKGKRRVWQHPVRFEFLHIFCFWVYCFWKTWYLDPSFGVGWGWGCQKNSDLDRSGSKVASKKKRSRGQWTTSFAEIIALWNIALSIKISSNFMNHESKIGENLSSSQFWFLESRSIGITYVLVFQRDLNGKSQQSCKGQLPSTQSLPKAKKSRLAGNVVEMLESRNVLLILNQISEGSLSIHWKSLKCWRFTVSK